jgi:hypothetical protein
MKNKYDPGRLQAQYLSNESIKKTQNFHEAIPLIVVGPGWSKLNYTSNQHTEEQKSIKRLSAFSCELHNTLGETICISLCKETM